MINLYNSCSLEAMKQKPDQYYDLAIVDPPYGVTEGMIGGLNNIPNTGKANKHLYQPMENDWNTAPGEEYFQELFRVSKRQIIWGGNYFPILWKKPCRGFIIWHKKPIGKLHADCELAWNSTDQNARVFQYRWSGAHTEIGSSSKVDRVHPTQKPVALYSWLLENYSQPGWRILDTHLGSGSIALAAHDYGVSLDGYEINKQYFDGASRRLAQHQSQLSIFELLENV